MATLGPADAAARAQEEAGGGGGGRGASGASVPAGAPALDALVHRLTSATAVAGHEQALADTLLGLLPGSQLDRLGNVVWRTGRGTPVRLAVCPLDEPGYVVGGVTPDGYLTLRRAGASPGPLFDQSHVGHPVTVQGRNGGVPGVVGVPSVHLQRGRPAAPDTPFPLDEAFVDVGASSAAEVEALGIEALSPVARTKRPHRYGGDLVAAPRAAARASCAALVEAARRTVERTGGTAAAVFTRGSLFGVASAEYAIAELAGGAAAEVVLLAGGTGRGTGPRPGAGTIVEAVRRFPDREGGREVRTWALPAGHPGTPVETVSLGDAAALARRIEAFWSGGSAASAGAEGADPAPTVARAAAVARAADARAADARAADVARGSDAGARPGKGTSSRGTAAATGDDLAEVREVLGGLVETHGVSGAEGAVRDAVSRLLPDWAKPVTDEAGNLRLRVGRGDPLVVFVAHLDEIGFAVTGLRDDGALDVEPRGGFFPWLFEAQPALVHTRAGVVPAVFAARDSSAAPVRDPGAPPVDPGTGSRAASEAAGIRIGDTVTMPKAFVPLAGTRATGRSFDDRVGCAALVLALRRLDPGRLPHAVEFVWSVREETGLEGAAFAAERLAGERPARVHAVDTFVTSDAPLERRTFAYAPLGKGAVIRAVDTSYAAPPALVDSLVRLAAAEGITLGVGTTAGGNDGSAFARFGVPGVAIGWPLRYSHSPAEVADLADVLALARVVLAVAERW